ncbi:MAG: pSer/pThr/pTyr-binding forkhead associated (FHA) protein [Granulosicoccus sp.]
MSTNHAAIVREGSKWKVVDQLSVNGDRINIRYFNHADILRFAPIECLFVEPTGYDGAATLLKNKKKGFPSLKKVVPIAILLILGAGY